MLRAGRLSWYAAFMRAGLRVVCVVVPVLCAGTGACSSSSSTSPPAGTARAPEAVCEASGDPEACAAAAELYFDGGIARPGPRSGRGPHPVDHARSFRYASAACAKGHAFGCALLGYHHQDGLGGAEWVADKAIAAYEKACAGGAGVGCYNLASMYYGGHGVTADEARADGYKAKAKAAWQAACRGSAPRWCTNVAYLLREEDEKGNRETCLELDQRSCDHQVLVGCTEATRDRLALGRIDAAAAEKELERLCAEGEPTACTAAGSMLIAGRDGMKAEPRRGAELVVRGCDGGDKVACLSAGFEYAKGELVPRDLAAADRYVLLGCERGLGDACLAAAEQRGSAGRYAEMAQLARRACQMGQGEGCGALGQLYFTGQGVTASEAAGVTWVTEGCRMGHAPSCAELVQRDRELPVPPRMKERIYRDGCAAGVALACRRLRAAAAAAPPL